MPRMNDLDICIQDVARDDIELRESLTIEISSYLAGRKEFKKMSAQAQHTTEVFYTNNY